LSPGDCRNKNKLTVRKELLIYRIVHEAVFNALKHSKASEITVFFRFTPENLFISVRDNGIGFLIDSLSDTTAGTGMINMKYRVELLGAELKVESLPAKGTVVSLDCSVLKNS
jgi:signal transduction histidine kinase